MSILEWFFLLHLVNRVHSFIQLHINHFINPTKDLDLCAQIGVVEARNKVIQTNDTPNEFDIRENVVKEKNVFYRENE